MNASSVLFFMQKRLGVTHTFGLSTTTYVGIAFFTLVAMLFGLILTNGPSEWYLGLRPHYFHCDQESHRLASWSSVGPNPETLWESYSKKVRDNEANRTSLESRDIEALLESQKSHFFNEVSVTTSDILEGRPVYLSSFGLVDLEEFQHHRNIKTGWVHDDQTGLPILSSGECSPPPRKDEAHHQARRYVAEWFALHHQFANNSLHRIHS
jgi:hypothetical protein